MEARKLKTFKPAALTLFLSALAALLVLTAGTSGAYAQSGGDKEKGTSPAAPAATQTIPGSPLRITVDDYTRMAVYFTDPSLGFENVQQFYSEDAEGVFLWAYVGGTVRVFGPPTTDAGNTVNGYTPVSNVLSGAGSPSNPWVITTVVSVPDSNLRLTRRTIYVNGAEFVRMEYTVSQVGGAAPVNVTLFHAADLYTAGSDDGYGFYDPETGGVGSYFTITVGTRQRSFFQQFVPNIGSPAYAYEEDYYSVIWDKIGDSTAFGTGFDNTIRPEQHDAGAGLQWNLIVVPGGSVVVGDTDLFSLNAALCGSFSDVRPSDFAYDHISFLACRGIVSGYADTTFRPNNNVTRGQLAKIVSNSAGYAEPVSGQTFQDVPPSNAFYPFVERMVARGHMGGYPCGIAPAPACQPGNRPYFLPNSNATRGQISKIVSNAAGFNDTPSGQIFEDVSPTNPFYVWVQRLASRGIMSGYNCGGPGEPCGAGNKPYFRWANNATRAQSAKIVANTFFPTCCPTSPQR